MVSRQLPLLALVLALVSPLGSAQDTPYATSKLLQIPLKRHAMSHHPSHRAVRMLHQQERIRRRLAEGDDGDADGDGDADETEDDGESTDELLPPVNVTVGPVVFNEVPLGVGYGTHYAELYLGIPTQKASVIVDTGSHLTALPCSSCKGCGTHTDPSFDMSKSTTAKYVTCKQYTECSSCDKDKCYISQSYTEGSMWSAVVVDDLVWLGGMNDKHPERFLKHYGVRFPVGCQEKETGLFIKQKENGIMGFGRDKATLMSYMVKEKRVEHNVFAMCFSPSGGGLVLGGVDYSHHRTKVSYTPLVVDYSNWYPVKVKDILVGDKTLGVTADKLNSGKGVIVDSGTTDTFFASAASRAFKSVYSKMAGVDYSEDEMSISAEKVALLPNITIVLEGTAGEPDIALEVPATKYLTKADDGTYYGNFHFSERSGGVLGASTMVGYDVIFDMDQKRIGFAESNCDMHSPKSKTFAPPSEPKKITEPTIEETNTTSPSSGSKASTSSAPPASGDQSPAAGTAISNEATGSKSSAKSSGSFFGQILVVSVVGIVAVVAFKRVRKSSWVPLNESETGRNSLNRDDSLEDGEAPGDVTSPPRRKAASPMSPGSPPGSPPAPRFTIGSDSESETGGSPRNVTEL